MKTTKQYKYNLTYRFNKVNNLQLIVNNHNQFLLVDKNKFIINITQKHTKYLNKQNNVREIKPIDRLPYFNRVIKIKILQGTKTCCPPPNQRN